MEDEELVKLPESSFRLKTGRAINSNWWYILGVFFLLYILIMVFGFVMTNAIKDTYLLLAGRITLLEDKVCALEHGEGYISDGYNGCSLAR